MKIVILLLVLAGGFLLNLCLGEIFVSPSQACQAVMGAPPLGLEPGIYEMLWQIRLPRLLAAFVVGTGLSISGYLLQALSRNYLADPYLTGVSSGAGLAVVLASMGSLDFALLPVAALAGGLVASLIVAFMSSTSSGLSITRLLLSGVAISAICGSLITLLLTCATGAVRAQGLLFWLSGSISGRGWAELTPAAFWVGAGTIAAFILSKPLRLLSLGSHGAAALGLNVALAQWLILATAVVLCGAAVSLSGLVGFVGLIAPYLSRQLFGRDERVHLVTTACLGGMLVLLSDLAARTLAPGQELPLGTLLSLIGAPFFLWLVLKQKGEGL